MGFVTAHNKRSISAGKVVRPGGLLNPPAKTALVAQSQLLLYIYLFIYISSVLNEHIDSKGVHASRTCL